MKIIPVVEERSASFCDGKRHHGLVASKNNGNKKYGEKCAEKSKVKEKICEHLDVNTDRRVCICTHSESVTVTLHPG